MTHLVFAIACLLSTAVPEDDPTADLDILIEVLAGVDDVDIQVELLSGLGEGLAGRRRVAMPDSWPKVFAALIKSRSRDVREKALAIALVFDDPTALQILRRTLSDSKAATASRLRALDALVGKRVEGLATTLYTLLADESVRRAALRALAAFDDSRTPAIVLALYPKLEAGARADALSTLCSRPSYALELLAAIEKGSVPRRDVTAVHARQIQRLGDERVLARLRAVWGDVRKTSAEKLATIATLKKALTPSALKRADVRNGRLLFSKTCAKCHRLYDDGAAIGPELTGSNRADLEYILENLVDPTAAIGKDYQLNTAVTRRGRVVSGIIKERGAGRVTIQTENELVTLPDDEILTLSESESSMMPDGLLANLSKNEIRDLIAYLATSSQVPLPAQ